MNVNEVTLVGRLTKKPELIKNNKSDIVKFSMATNRQWTDKNTGAKVEKVEFHNITFFGKVAGVICQWFDKGDEIYVRGRLQTDKYTNKKGIEVYSTGIIGENFKFGQKKRGSEGNQPVANTPATPNNEVPIIEEKDIDIDDINF